MRRIAAGILGLLLLAGLSGCDMTLMQEPTEAYMETFGTKPPDTDPGQMLMYREAMGKLQSKDYPGAYALLLELGDFRDAAEYAARFWTMEDVLLKTVVNISDPYQPDHTVWHHYDQQGRVVLEEHISAGNIIESVTYTYDGDMEIRQDSAGMLMRAFDGEGRLSNTQEHVGFGSEQTIYTTSYLYGQGNLLLKDNGTEQRRTGNRYHTTETWSGTYTYDDQGRLSQYDRSITWGATGSYQELYTYDEAGNLVRLEIISKMQTSSDNTVEEYTYDEAGNRLTLDRRVIGKVQGEDKEHLWDLTHIDYTWQDGRLIQEVQVVGDVDKVTTTKEYIYGDYLCYRVQTGEGG